MINEFQNEPGIESSRGGDPSTSLRQFAQGYVGFQNHGGADTMQYRDVRVEDLSADAPGRNPTGKFTVTGAGPHTVEFRSIDAAGNVEATQAADFEIGATAPPPTPPASDPPMPPAIDTPAAFRLGRLAVADRREAVRPLRPAGARDVHRGDDAATATLRVSAATARKLKLGRRTVASRGVRCYGAHTATVTLKPSKSLRKKLVKGARGSRSVRLTLAVQMADIPKPATSTRETVVLR